MKYVKVKAVKSPTRATPQAAGIDFFVPTFTDAFLQELINVNMPMLRSKQLRIYSNEIIIAPGASIKIPSGIHVNFQRMDTNLALIAQNKSGVSSSTGLARLAGIIDQDYQGEITISLYNSSNSLQVIEPEQKLIQFILTPILIDTLEDAENLEVLYPSTTERGSMGFGKKSGNE